MDLFTSNKRYKYKIKKMYQLFIHKLENIISKLLNSQNSYFMIKNTNFKKIRKHTLDD